MLSKPWTVRQHRAQELCMTEAKIISSRSLNFVVICWICCWYVVCLRSAHMVYESLCVYDCPGMGSESIDTCQTDFRAFILIYFDLFWICGFVWKQVKTGCSFHMPDRLPPEPKTKPIQVDSKRFKFIGGSLCWFDFRIRSPNHWGWVRLTKFLVRPHLLELQLRFQERVRDEPDRTMGYHGIPWLHETCCFRLTIVYVFPVPSCWISDIGWEPPNLMV